MYHDTVHPEIQHVKHENTQRDLHTHEVHHRTLPVKDVLVLPTKHYAPLGPNGALVEIDESEVADVTADHRNWHLKTAEQPTDERSTVHPDHERHISKNLQNGEGQHKSYVTQEGVPRTETTWIHPPTVDTSPPNERRQYSENPSAPVKSLGDTTGSHSTEPGPVSQMDHERNAEATVTARRQASRSHNAGVHDSQKRFHEQPREQQEAHAARLAARRAAGHVPGSFAN